MDWKSEGQFLFTVWRDAMKDCRHLAYGNTTGLRWDDLAEEIQNAWVIAAQQVHQRYSTVVVFDAAKITLPPEAEESVEAYSQKMKKRKKDQE